MTLPTIKQPIRSSQLPRWGESLLTADVLAPIGVGLLLLVPGNWRCG
jgi:hypothetical protein